MTTLPLHFQTLTEVARRLRDGEITATELVTVMLERIARVDAHVQAYVTVTAERARAAARRADEEIAAGRYRGPLHGMPIAVKDLCFTRGVATMAGSGALRDHVPSFDGTVVARLEASGAVLLGKLNTTEGAMVGYHPDFEIPRNPWGDELWPGASSSGSGAATAAGLCFASLGTDTGGSIRYPSAMNGIVGLKPTWGRVSRYGVFDLAPSLDHVGPMTRSVADAAVMLQAIAGRDENDPTTLPDEPPDYVAGLDEPLAGIRLGYDETFTSSTAAPHVAAAVRAAVEQLATLGATVVELTLPEMEAGLQAWNIICAAEAAAAHRATYPSRADDYGPWFRGWLELGTSVSGVQYARAHELRLQLNGKLRQALRDVDVLACPTVATEPIPYRREEAYGPFSVSGSSIAGVPADWFARSARFTGPFDFNGYPTLSLPCGASDDGLPLSLQLVGQPLGEPLLLRLGSRYEAATAWHRMHPPSSEHPGTSVA